MFPSNRFILLSETQICTCLFIFSCSVWRHQPCAYYKAPLSLCWFVHTNLHWMELICWTTSVLKTESMCTGVVCTWDLHRTLHHSSQPVPTDSRSRLGETWRWQSGAGSASVCLTRDETQFSLTQPNISRDFISSLSYLALCLACLFCSWGWSLCCLVSEHSEQLCK